MFPGAAIGHSILKQLWRLTSFVCVFRLAVLRWVRRIYHVDLLPILDLHAKEHLVVSPVQLMSGSFLVDDHWWDRLLLLHEQVLG